MKKRTSTIEKVYNCNNDHKCESNQNEINSIQYRESEEEQNILICAIDFIIQDQEMIDSSLITSDESMVISPNNTINKSCQNKRKTRTPEGATQVWKKVDEYASIMTSNRSQGTNISTSESSDWSINEQRQISPDNPTTSTKTMQTSTPHRPSGPLLEKMSERTLFEKQVEESEEPSWCEAAQQRLLESEKQGLIHKKYKQLEPLVESPNSSWGEIAEQRLFKSELTGKGYRKHPKSTPSTPERPSGSSLEERNTTRVGQWIKEAIIQLSQRETHNPMDEWLDKCIRVKHKLYLPVEVNKDRNGRMIYTPLKPSNKPEISFGAELRTPR